MPPFEYHGYTSPYVQSISALLQAPGQIEAQRAQTTGNAWANAAQQTGQAVSGAIQQATDPRRKLEAAQLIEAQQKIAAGQRAVSDQSAIDTAMSPSHPMGPPEQGATQQMPARDAILNALPGHLRGVVQKQFDDTDKNRAEVQKARNDYLTSMTEHLAGLRYNLEYWKGDPTVAKLSLDDAKQTYANDPEMLRHIASAAQAIAADQTPANILKIAGTLPTTEKYAALSKKAEGFTLSEGQTRFNDDGSVIATGPVKAPTVTEAQLDAEQQRILAKAASGQPLTPTETASKTAYEQRKRTVSDPAAIAATERQASAQAAATAQQARAQGFQEQQQGRKELTEKVEQPYQTAASSAQTLRDTVALAKNGNMSAAALQSLETTMAAIRSQGLNRINTAEIGVSANAGSLWDNIVGRVGKLSAGQPVDAALQKDMQQFASMLEKAAYQKYLAGHASVTRRYGLSDEKPLAGPTMYVRDKKGVLHTAPYGTPIPPDAREE